MISGPLSYRVFRETGPWAAIFRLIDSFRVTWSGIRHRNQLTAKAWEKAVHEVGNERVTVDFGFNFLDDKVARGILRQSRITAKPK